MRFKNIPQFGDPPLFAGPGFANRTKGSSVTGGSTSDCAINKLILPYAISAVISNL
ncbi:MAG: hypothetical protein U5J96_19635 [Ignavibacteriaceae bacterium]|nr:hypothetical protein [Ignavibacteriaceae bacterium]